MMLKQKLKILSILFLFSNFALAEDIPTVDDINKQTPQFPKQAEPLPSDTIKKLDQSVETQDENKLFKVLVKDFLFEGNKKYSSEELKIATKELIDQELGYNDLLNVSRLVSNYYRSKGFLATAYLPPQDIENGIVKIKVVEAVLGKIIYDLEEGEKLNLSKEKIDKRILFQIEKEGILDIAQLDKNIRNLNKIAGLNAIATLEEGNNFGETNIKVTALNTKTLSGNSFVDNNGSRSSGYNRFTNSINFDGLLNAGERITLTNILSGDHHTENHEKSNYYAISSSFPIGLQGTEATLRVSKMEYKLSAPFDSTLPSGYSSEYNLTVNKPLIESLNFNLSSSLSLANNKYVNDLSTGNNSDKDVLKSILGLSFDSRDQKLGGGVNYGSFNLSLAKLDLTDNFSNYETDQAGADSNGRNFKGTLNLNRLQKLTEKTNLLIKFNGQLSPDNLDGSDQFSLGGPNGVRAYPSNEAAGDSGFVTSLELKRNLFNKIESSLFYDYGKIKLHESLWTNWNSSNTNLKNNYHIRGWGVSFGIPFFNAFNLNATYAKKLGHNSGRDSTGKDVDGLTFQDRGLISLSGQF